MTREKATERAFTGRYWDHHEQGIYRCVCLRHGALRLRHEVRLGLRLAELLRGHRPRQRARGTRHEPRHGAHRDRLQCLRLAPRPRLPGRTATHRPALLHQLRVAEVRAEAGRDPAKGPDEAAVRPVPGHPVLCDLQGRLLVSRSSRSRWPAARSAGWSATGPCAARPGAHPARDGGRDRRDVLQVSWLLAAARRVEPMLWVSLAVIVVFGGATIWFHDETFIKWKPTILYWLFAGALVAGRPAVEAQPAQVAAVGTDSTVPDPVWDRLLAAWVAFFGALGVVNLASRIRCRPTPGSTSSCSACSD